ncbi:unnamed protein product [Dovyalis caffra]|uniref:Uncharacterized protein n=1 Tax=Dovyalis caffra TaxID=77055 RepID=A0AAV1RZ83_9ROSI|nr:unnamed protein product [Dovyalis caffra]
MRLRHVCTHANHIRSCLLSEEEDLELDEENVTAAQCGSVPQPLSQGLYIIEQRIDSIS